MVSRFRLIDQPLERIHEALRDELRPADRPFDTPRSCSLASSTALTTSSAVPANGDSCLWSSEASVAASIPMPAIVPPIPSWSSRARVAAGFEPTFDQATL